MKLSHIDVGDSFEMLVAESLYWRLVHFVGDFWNVKVGYQHLKLVIDTNCLQIIRQQN